VVKLPMPLLLRADARSLPLADASVDLVVTSPPYFALRSYTDGGEHYAGQLGSEATPAEFLDALVDCTREMVRVLKPSGSIFVNLGDKYAGSVIGGQTTTGLQGGRDKHVANTSQRRLTSGFGGAPTKSLLLLPERYRIRCVDELGLIARAVIVWCLSGGARVYARTATGDRPVMLRDLARAYRPETVQLWNGERWTQVLGWNRTSDNEAALELELRTGERIGCTPNHQWPTSRGLLRSDEIRVGDIIETTRLPEPAIPRMPALLPDEDIGWLIGLYIAEGSRSEATIQFAGHINETARHARLARIAEALDGSCAVYQTSENGGTCNLHGSVIIGVIDRYVSTGTAKTKRLRHAAWQRSNEFLSAVVEGYLSGDGDYDAKNDRWRLGFTANDEWAAGLRTLAARLGTVLRLRRTNHTMSGRSFPGWHGEWRWQRAARGWSQDGEVVAIRRSRARDFYDLGVADEPHLFALASGVLTHNSKPNGLPESVTDRVRRSHEDWVHITRLPRYFSAVDEIRQPVSGYERVGASRPTPTGQRPRAMADSCNPLGRLPGSVWEIATQPLNAPAHLDVDHFAAFPMEWPRRFIAGWCPREVCTACGEGRRPVIAVRPAEQNGGRARLAAAQQAKGTTTGGIARTALGVPASDRNRAITGYACACSDTTAPSSRGVVLDPFGGTGTAALVATMLGRRGISVDLSADYQRLARWRASDPRERARAAGLAADSVAAVAPANVDQPALWGETG
jgi:hypothetical protein